MENMTQEAAQMSDEIKTFDYIHAVQEAADEIKVAENILSIHGDWLQFRDGVRDIQRQLRLHHGRLPRECIPVETVKGNSDKDYVDLERGVKTEESVRERGIKMESVGVREAVEDECWWKNKIEYVVGLLGYANDSIGKMAKPKMGLMFSGATMQNISQLVTSGMVTTGKGKALLKLNEAAFMFLLYGLVMPRRAAGHVALAIGVALASAAYLVTMSFAF